MTERELKCICQRICQRIEAGIPATDDGRLLVREVKRLRVALADIRNMTIETVIIERINEALRVES